MMLFAIPRIRKATTLMPPGSHWITVSRAAHPSSPLAGRHLLINSAGVIIGGAVPSEFYGKTLAEVHIVGAAATDHPLHEALRKAAGEAQHPLSDTQIDTLAEAFHAHPSDGTHARFRTMMGALEKMGFKRSDAKHLTARTANALMKAKHLHSRDINAWSKADTGVPTTVTKPTAKPVAKPATTSTVPSVVVSLDTVKAVMRRTIMKSLEGLSPNDDAITENGMVDMNKLLAAASRSAATISKFGRAVGEGVVFGVFEPSAAKHAMAAALKALETVAPEGMKEFRDEISRRGFKGLASYSVDLSKIDAGLRIAFGDDVVAAFNKSPIDYFPELTEKVFRAMRESSRLEPDVESAVRYVSSAMSASIQSAGRNVNGLIALRPETPWEVKDLEDFIMLMLNPTKSSMLNPTKSLDSPLLYGALAIGDVPETFDPSEVSRTGAAEIFLEALQKAFPKMSVAMMMREFRGGEIGKKDRPARFKEFDKAIQDTFADFPFYQNSIDALREAFDDRDSMKVVAARMVSKKLMYAHLLVTDDVAPWWMKKIEQRTGKFMIKSDPVGGRRTLSKASPQETAEIEKLVAGSVNSHHIRKPVVKAVYKLDYDHPEFDALAKKYGNVQRLFHGTKNEFAGMCMVSGLKVPGKEVPVGTGSMFGRGIYFADQSTKSGLYCTRGDDAVLFVCDVALGNEEVLTMADSSLSSSNIKDRRQRVVEIKNPEKTRDFLKDIEAENVFLSVIGVLVGANTYYTTLPVPLTPEQQTLFRLMDKMLEKARSGKLQDVVAALKYFSDNAEHIDDSRTYITLANSRLAEAYANARRVDDSVGKSDTEPGNLSQLVRQEVIQSRYRRHFVRALTNNLTKTSLRSDSPIVENVLSAVKRFESRTIGENDDGVSEAFNIKEEPVHSVHAVPSGVLKNNEWAVYDENQVQMRYAVHVSIERNDD